MRPHGHFRDGPELGHPRGILMMVVTTGGNVIAIKQVLLEPDIDP